MRLIVTKILPMLLMLLPLTILNATTQSLANDSPEFVENRSFELTGPNGITTYTPKFSALNFEGPMTLTPIFTPDNAFDVHAAWIAKANSTIDIQNQYLTQFDGDPWSTDSNPIVRGIVDAAVNRSVTVRVQINDDKAPDYASDDVTSYLNDIFGIEVRWMGASGTDSGDGYLSQTHNKMVIIDGKVVLVSSINFSEPAFTKNREAGMVIQSQTAANYYASIFESDWEDGEAPSLANSQPLELAESQRMSPSNMLDDFPSHTNIPDTNFTGIYNITLFTNPDNADDVIFRYLESAQTSIYVSMYTISREDFTDTLIALKNANPALDIQVLISYRRVGSSENVDTKAAAEELVANLIPVYNSTRDADKVNDLYHNKYWLIDGKHTFVYSGNWSPRSVTPQASSYTSGDANRDMGVAVHDAPNVAAHFKDVWDEDVAVGSAWELPVGVKQTGFSAADVLSGTVTISGLVAGLEGATISYRWDTGSYATVTASGESFSTSFDTTTLPNGIHTLEVKAEKDSQAFTDSVKVNVANYAPAENWRVLITEVLPDPQAVSDTEGEFVELSNTFPFAVLLGGWQIGDDKAMHTFASDYEIERYSSIVIARDKSSFQSAYGTTAEIELAFSLSNSGDYIQFKDAEGNYMDVVAYGEATAADNSEVMVAPSAGQSLQRTKMYLDTDKAADFSIGSPDPKGAVPNEPLITDPSFTARTDTTEAPTSWLVSLIALLLLPMVWRKRKKL